MPLALALTEEQALCYRHLLQQDGAVGQQQPQQQEAASYLARVLGLPDHQTDVRAAVQLDSAVLCLQLSQQLQLSHDQANGLLSLLAQLLECIAAGGKRWDTQQLLRQGLLARCSARGVHPAEPAAAAAEAAAGAGGEQPVAPPAAAAAAAAVAAPEAAAPAEEAAAAAVPMPGAMPGGEPGSVAAAEQAEAATESGEVGAGMGTATPKPIPPAAHLTPEQVGAAARALTSLLLQPYALYSYVLTCGQKHVQRSAKVWVEQPVPPPPLAAALPQGEWEADKVACAAAAAAEAAAAVEAQRAAEAAAAAQAEAVQAAAAAAACAEHLSKKPQTLEEAVDQLVALRLEELRTTLEAEFAQKQAALGVKLAALEAAAAGGAAKGAAAGPAAAARGPSAGGAGASAGAGAGAGAAAGGKK